MPKGFALNGAFTGSHAGFEGACIWTASSAISWSTRDFRGCRIGGRGSGPEWERATAKKRLKRCRLLHVRDKNVEFEVVGFGEHYSGIALFVTRWLANNKI
jgi:hypothetical protein